MNNSGRPKLKSLARQALTQERPELTRQLLGKATEDAGMSHSLRRPNVNIGEDRVPGHSNP